MRVIPQSIDIGCKREDIGTHSNRKFAESMAVSRVDGPNRTQVCLRAGQSVGRTQDCYFFAEEDGDSLVGRTVAQLKFNADEFDVLPPHFSNETMAMLYQYGWSVILPSFNSYPQSFQRVIPYLLAQLIFHHHKGNLSRILSPNHPLFSCALFRTHRQLVDLLKDKVIICHGECLQTHMTAQGVPGFIVVSREVREIKRYFQIEQQALREEFNLMRREINECVEELPGKIIDQLLENIRIEGVQPITLQSIREMIMVILTSEASPLHSMNLEMRNISQTLAASRTNDREIEDELRERVNRVQGNVHYWPNDHRIHLVPEGFLWPQSLNTRVMWDFWMLGNADLQVTSYRKIEPNIELQTKGCRTMHSKTKKIMKKLIDILQTDGEITSIADINQSNSEALFNHSFKKLVEAAYANSSSTRHGDLTLNTIYERLRIKKLIK